MMPLNYSVLIVLPDHTFAEQLAVHLSALGYRPIVLDHPRQALEAASLHDCCAAVLGDRLPEIPGIQLTQMLRLRIADLPVLLLVEGVPGESDKAAVEGWNRGEGECRTEVTHWLPNASLGEIESRLESAVERPPAGRVDSPSPPKTSLTSTPSSSPGTYGIYVG